MKKQKWRHSNGGLALVFIVLVAISIALAYLIFVKKARLGGLADSIRGLLTQTTRQKAAPATPNAFVPPETLTPRAAFDEIGGFPRASREVDILENLGYATGYSEDLMDPLWSAYYCGPEETYPVGSRAKLAFIADTRIPETFRLKSEDYKRPSGSPTYDRGHMAPNYAIASRYGPQAQVETFYMTNIAPQRSTLNQQTWRYLEGKITDTYAPGLKGVWVIVGPVFVKQQVTRYNGKAAMPDGFFCVLLDRDEATGQLKAIALYLKQNVSGNHKPREFVTTVRALEEHTGLDFFSELPTEVQDALETSAPDAEWQIDQPLADSGKKRD
jgi:endonuclease G